MGKGTRAGDVLLILVVVVVAAAAVGAILGYSANRFGLSSGARVAIMVGFLSIVGRVSQLWITRRAKSRSSQP